MDPEVTPVAQKPRRVPLALREKVTAKVEDLIAKDIVERVDGPTSWVSPVVVAPKAEGDIRLCVDMRKANQAIIRERIPIPTVDEVIENLNGSAVFSKLDLRLGFHQIELDEESRDIATFATHEGLFRYKRLSFGVNSAPEKYQQIIRQVVSDIDGVQNIADDLIVHGKSIEEHDQSLHKVLQRLEEKNLTLNPMKCEFRMDKVVFMGLLLSKYGIGPTEERVRAVLEAVQPTTPTEVRSFLGMVGFSARFIHNFSTLAEPLRAISRQGVPFVWARENEGTEREAQGVGRDMLCPRKLFLDERKSVFRDVRMQSCLALRFLVKRENDGARGRLMNIYFLSNIGPRLACMRTSRKTSVRLKITFVDMTYPKGWTGSLPLCPLIFSWYGATSRKNHLKN